MSERDDDVSQLKFSRDFADVEFIDNTTVFVLLNAIRDKRAKDEAEGRLGLDAPRPSEAFERAREYAGRFGGALHGLQGRPVEEIDAVSSQLQQLRFALTPEEARLARARRRGAERAAAAGGAAGGVFGDDYGGGGGGGGGMGVDEEDEDEAEAAAAAEPHHALHSYEVVALVNLNPPTVAVAKSLVPSLEKFRDEDLEQAVAVLRKSAAKRGKADDAAADGAEGAAGGAADEER